MSTLGFFDVNIEMYIYIQPEMFGEKKLYKCISHKYPCQKGRA